MGCVFNPIGCAANEADNLFFGSLDSWISGASSWVWHELGSGLSGASSSTVIVAAAKPEFERLAALAPIVAAAALCAAILSSLRHAQPSAMVRDLAAGVILVAVGIVGALPAARMVLAVSDALSSAASTNVATNINAISNGANQLPSVVPGFGVFLLDLAGIFGALLLWFELVIRNALMALTLALSPIVMAAAIWAPLRRMAVRIVETFIALALAKTVVVVALSLGATAIATGSAGVVVTGLAAVLVATLAPFTLLRLVPLFESSAVLAAEGLRQRAQHGLRRGASVARAGAEMAMPSVTPGPPTTAEDFGIDDWPASPAPAMPADSDAPVVAPVGEPRYRYGKPNYTHDEEGKPYMGWHWDE